MRCALLAQTVMRRVFLLLLPALLNGEAGPLYCAAQNCA
jgi:hypothetical protein